MRPGYPDVIKLLLRDAEQRQGLGHARWVAAHHGNDEPIRLLLAKCANMNFWWDGTTSLDSADQWWLLQGHDSLGAGADQRSEANCLGQSTGRYPSPQEPSHLVVPNPQLVGDELLVMTCIDLDYSADATRIDGATALRSSSTTETRIDKSILKGVCGQSTVSFAWSGDTFLTWPFGRITPFKYVASFSYYCFLFCTEPIWTNIWWTNQIGVLYK